MKKKTIIKIISIIFVLLWMMLVFMLSNEVATESSGTSEKVIRFILKIFNCNVTENILELLQPIIRKMAHFVLYALGGMLIYNMCLQLEFKRIKIKSFCIGMFYAITDEIHQLFVEGRSGELRDVIIDSTGVLLGIFVISFIAHLRGENKLAKKQSNNNKIKKVLFTATVDSHILHFHVPYLKLFKEKGYEVHVATNDDEEIPYCDVKHKVSFERSPIKINNLKAIKQLKKIIDNERFEIIHCHTPMGSVVTRLAARKARENGTRVIYTAHGFHFYKGAPKANWMIFYPIEKILSRYTDTLITINKEDYELAKAKFHCDIEYIPGVGVNKEKFNINMTEQEKDELRKEIGITQKDFVMCIIGELNENKNQKLALEVMKELANKNSNLKLLLIGEGNLREEYEQYISENNLSENVYLLGYRTDVPKLLQISNLQLSLSYREGLPVNVIEGMITGVPVIVTNCRGNRDLVQDDANGYIIEHDDKEKLIELIERIFNKDEQRENFRKNSIEISNQYLLDNIINEYKKVYKILI